MSPERLEVAVNDTTATLISSDSHVTEPPDLWTSRLDPAFRDRAPHYLNDPERGGLYFVVENQIPQQVNVNIAAGQRPEDYEAFFRLGLESGRPGGWDPAARLEDMDADGIEASVLYTSQGFSLFAIADAAYQTACFHAYNDWMSEYCAHAPSRLAGIAMISLFDVETAVAELERCARLGLRGAMIWGRPPEAMPFDSERYEPFWFTAADLRMPLSLHIGTGGDRGAKVRAESDEPYWQDMDRLVALPSEVQCALTTLAFSGVMERHSDLVFISAEYDIGWLPYFLQNLDRLYQRWSPLLGLGLTEPPSHYVRRQVRLTFIRDRAGLGMLGAGLLDADAVMWCDDYPHGASTFPDSRSFVDETMADLPTAHRRKIVHDTAASLYGLGPRT